MVSGIDQKDVEKEGCVIFLIILIAVLVLLVALAPSILAATFFLDTTKNLDSINREVKKRNQNAEKEAAYYKELVNRINERQEQLYFDNRSVHFHHHSESGGRPNGKDAKSIEKSPGK